MIRLRGNGQRPELTYPKRGFLKMKTFERRELELEEIENRPSALAEALAQDVRQYCKVRCLAGTGCGHRGFVS